MSWTKVQRRIAQLIKEDKFFTEAEQDAFEHIDPIAIREALAERGIVNGESVDPEAPDSDPFIQQVLNDTEQISRDEQRISDEAFASEHLIPRESTYEIDGRRFVVDSVNLDFGTVSLQDVTFQNMDEHGFSYDAMTERKAELSAKEKELTAKIAEAQNRIAAVNVLKTQIVNYSKTRDVYVAYRKSGYSKKLLEEHEADIIIHKAAKKAFDELGVKKLPTVKSLQVEFAEKLAEKKEAYAELKKVRDEFRDLTVHTANYEELRDLAERDPRKEKEHGRE